MIEALLERHVAAGGIAGAVALVGRGDAADAAESVRRMMQDHNTPAQKAASPFFPGFWDDNGWGYGGAVVTRATAGGPRSGSYGWDGGYGTSMTIDPAADTIVVLLARLMTGADSTAIAARLRRVAYADRRQTTEGERV